MALPPLERLRAVAAGSASLAPVAATFGIVLDEVEPGRVVARMPALPPSPLRGSGALLVLADLVLTTSIATTVRIGSALSTLTLHLAELGPLPREGTAVVAAGHVVRAEDGGAVSEAELRTTDGMLVARSSARCGVFAAPSGDGGTQREPDLPGRGFDDVNVQTDRSDGVSTTMAAAAATCANSGGAVQGGVLAALAADAVADVIEAARPRLSDAPTDLDVTFLRGVPADGGATTTRAELVHAGSRLAAARAELRDATGRLAVVASAARWRS